MINLKKVLTPKKKFLRIIFFIFDFVLRFIVSYHFCIYSFKSVVDISSGKNLLHYFFKFVSFAVRFFHLLIDGVEIFLANEKFEKFYKEGKKIEKILVVNFHKKICKENIEKVKKRRKILVILQTIFHEGIYLVTFVKNFEKFVEFLCRFVRTFYLCFIVYRFCNLVDFINLHLMVLTEISENTGRKFKNNCKAFETSGTLSGTIKSENFEILNLTSIVRSSSENSKSLKKLKDKNEKLICIKILKLRECFLHIIKMQDYFMDAVRWSLLFEFLTLVLALLRRLYKVYNGLKGEIPFKESRCMFKFF